MSRRTRIRSTVHEVEPAPRRRRKRNSRAIVIVFLVILLALFFIHRTRQVSQQKRPVIVTR